MVKHIVTITETLIYKIEVEGANNEKEAEDLAFASPEFADNLFKDNDAVVTSVIEVE